MNKASAAKDMIDFINDNLAAGRTIYVSTYTRSVKVTAKTAKAWADKGHNLFKLSGNSAFMARGKSWDCIDFCKITAQ